MKKLFYVLVFIVLLIFIGISLKQEGYSLSSFLPSGLFQTQEEYDKEQMQKIVELIKQKEEFLTRDKRRVQKIMEDAQKQD